MGTNSRYSAGDTLVVETDVAKCNTSYGIWRFGHNSHKSNEVRSFWLFADGLSGTGKRTGNARPVGSHQNSFIGRMNAYWKSKGLETNSGGPTWSKDIIQAAFDGTALAHSDSSKGNVFNFATAGSTFRKEVIQKGISYLNVFPYVIWEMQDAINDCHDGDLSSNDAATKTFGESVYAWDEAVAFYTGSREGTAKGGVGDLSGGMQYYLANKRCENFGTCTADTDGDNWSGSSKVNQEVFDLFDLGKRQLKEAAALTVKGSGTSCDVVVPTMEKGDEDAHPFHSRDNALSLQNQEFCLGERSRRAFYFRFGRPSFHRCRRSSGRGNVVSSCLGSRLYRQYVFV